MKQVFSPGEGHVEKCKMVDAYKRGVADWNIEKKMEKDADGNEKEVQEKKTLDQNCFTVHFPPAATGADK